MANYARWGIGALKSENRDTALPGEIMVDHDIGILSTKSYAGALGNASKVTSYAYIQKLSDDFTKFRDSLIATGYAGEIVKIDLGDYVAPSIIANGRNYNTSTLTISTKKVTFIKPYLSIDVVDEANGIPQIDINPTVTLSFKLAHSNTSNSDYMLDLNLNASAVNSTILVPDYAGYISGSVSYTFNLSSFSVTLPAKYSASDYKIILSSLMVAYQEVA